MGTSPSVEAAEGEVYAISCQGDPNDTFVWPGGALETEVSEATDSTMATDWAAAGDVLTRSGGEDPRWMMFLGPFSLSRRGFEIKPQWKIGGRAGSFRAEAGVGDVRDGLKFDAGLEAFVETETAGHSICEVHRLKVGAAVPARQREALGRALERAGRVFAAPASGAASLVDKIARSAGVGVDELKLALSERSERPITLRVRAVTGLGVSTGMCLGWCDTKGYRMVGVSTTVTNVVAFGGNICAGKHASGDSLKVILGIGNVTLEYTVPLAPKDTQVVSSAQAPRDTQVTCSPLGSQESHDRSQQGSATTPRPAPALQGPLQQPPLPRAASAAAPMHVPQEPVALTPRLRVFETADDFLDLPPGISDISPEDQMSWKEFPTCGLSPRGW